MEKEAYFNDIDGKKLYIDYIIFEYDYPILFVCIDKNNDLYLCHCYEIRGKQEWIISKTNREIIIGLLTDKITIFDSLNSPFGKNYIVTWSYEDKKETCNKVKFEEIDEMNLPEKDSFYESEEHEFDEYIKILNKRINNKENKNILELELKSNIYRFYLVSSYKTICRDLEVYQYEKGYKYSEYREESVLCY